MKQIFILRHAPRDNDEGNLTEEGKQKALRWRTRIGKFDLVISSPVQRCLDTAFLLTDIRPTPDERAGIIDLTAAQDALGTQNPLGYAGVIFEDSTLRDAITKKGFDLVGLINETFQKLPANGRALIISHDATILAANKLLNHGNFDKLDKTYTPLQGFIVTEDLKTKDFM